MAGNSVVALAAVCGEIMSKHHSHADAHQALHFVPFWVFRPAFCIFSYNSSVTNTIMANLNNTFVLVKF